MMDTHEHGLAGGHLPHLNGVPQVPAANGSTGTEGKAADPFGCRVGECDRIGKGHVLIAGEECHQIGVRVIAEVLDHVERTCCTHRRPGCWTARHHGWT